MSNNAHTDMIFSAFPARSAGCGFALTTLLRPTSGTITLDGLDPVTKPLEVRRLFGIVFQDPSLDGDLTAQENMDLTCNS
jgi:ABC-type multidrug transport system ATPase subunit